MNKHEPDCAKILCADDGPCTCGLGDPPPVKCVTASAIVSASPGASQAGAGTVASIDHSPACPCHPNRLPELLVFGVRCTCKEPHFEPSSVTMQMLGESDPTPCPYCHGTGRLTMPEPVVEAKPIYESHAT